jgi:hypothetical protein
MLYRICACIYERIVHDHAASIERLDRIVIEAKKRRVSPLS